MLIHCDGFDHYGEVARLQDFYGGFSNTAYSAIYSGVSGMTDKCVGTTSSNAPNMSFSFLNESRSHFLGVRAYIEGGAPYLGLGSFSIRINDGLKCFDIYNSSNGSGAVIGSTPPFSVAPASALYIEMNTIQSTTASSADGSFELRVNGVSLAIVTGRNTGATTSFNWRGYGGGSRIYIDDLYILDDRPDAERPACIGFLGDRQMITNLAYTDEVGNAWVPVGAATGSAAIDNVPTVAGQYIQASNVGDISRFGVLGVPSNAVSSAGGMVYVRAGKSDAGAARIGAGFETGGTVDYGTAISPSVGYGTFKRLVKSLTPAEINAGFLRVERLTDA